MGADVAVLRADNPGPFTLQGTNTYVVGRDPAWVLDPGPALLRHVTAVAEEVARRGGLGGVVLTHDHPDHAEGVGDLLRAAGVAEVFGRRAGTAHDGARIGPFTAVAAPGHAPDHLVYLTDDHVLFSGDAVLGEGSVFIVPDPGALAGYLALLRRLRELPLRRIHPGHGPAVDDPAAKLDEYLAHRLDRERRLLAALAEGRRGIDDLLDAAWSDAPAALRPAAAVSLAAHLDKLEDEGRLPGGVERPERPAWA